MARRLPTLTEVYELTTEDSESDDREVKITSDGVFIPLKVGDTILTGKFKNKRTVVKDVGVDDLGLPTVNGKKIVSFRFAQ